MTATVTDSRPTDKQLGFVRTLLKEREHTAPAEGIRDALNHHREAGTLTRKVISSAIDQLLAIKVERPAKAESKAPPAITELGMYRDGDDVIYRIVKSKSSGRLYAKRLVVVDRPEHAWTEVKDDDGNVIAVQKHDATFEYDAGAVYRLAPEGRMTVEEIKDMGILWNCCCVCGRHLTVAKSIEAGIGPVCVTRI